MVVSVGSVTNALLCSWDDVMFTWFFDSVVSVSICAFEEVETSLQPLSE